MKLSGALPAMHPGAPIAPVALLAGLMALPVQAGVRDDELDAFLPELACQAAADPRGRLPSGRHLAAMPREARPDKGAPHIDRVHGSCIVRVTDPARELPQGLARGGGTRRQAFNADESRLLLAAQDGRWHLYDARTLQHRAVLPAIGAEAEPRWHPAHPERLHYLPRQGTAMQLLELDVHSGRTRVAADFATRVKQWWPSAHAVRSRGEGAPSADGRYWAFLVDDAAGRGLGVFTWDLQEHRLIAGHDLAAHRQGRPERVTMGPSGEHVLVSWPEGAVAFTRDLAQPRRLPGGGEPAELALGADGGDAYVSIDREAAGAPLFTINLRTGERTDLFPTAERGRSTSLQVSGLAHRRPGWVLVASHADRGPGVRQWLHRRLMAVELRAAPRVVHLAFHRHPSAKPGDEPQATVNRDFTRVLFHSSWGGPAGAGTDAYLVLLPRGALAR